MAVKGYFIQYKFIIPEGMKHSSYTYQKLFRALYGYTQSVFKSNGKVYKYHRPGLLSKYPYHRPGKNCVIIPQDAFQELINFFKTGKNPSHQWQGKGEWKAVYYMNEKSLDETIVSKSIENLLERHYVINPHGKKVKLCDEVTSLVTEDGEIDKNYFEYLLNETQKVTENEWFKDAFQQSEKLKNLNTMYKQIKQHK